MTESSQKCPTCRGSGPDTFDINAETRAIEAECGDVWHDRFVTDKPVSDRPTVNELRKAAIQEIEDAYRPCLTSDATAKLTPEMWWAVKHAAHRLREIALAHVGKTHALADRLEEAEHKVNVAKMLEAARQVDIELRKKAEREVGRLRGLVNDAAHELVACNALAYAERLRAALRGGDRE